MRTAGVPDLREQLGDTFTYGEAKEAGVGDRRLYALRDNGAIISLSGGVYRWADAPPADSDLIEIAERVPHATLCLETALARHGLIDTIPAAIDIAIPRGSTRPALQAPSRIHQFDPRTFDLGREELNVGARRPSGCTRQNGPWSMSSAFATSKAARTPGRPYGAGSAARAAAQPS